MGKRTGRGGRSRGRRGKQKRTAPFDPTKHFMPPPVPDREYSPDPFTGEPIGDVLTAIADPSSGHPANFDSVLERVAAKETLGEDERIAYIGKGAFGIVAMTREKGRPKLVVKKRIQFEDSREYYAWRKELSPGISRDYVPEPQPIADLYTPEELSRFPRFDSSGAVYNLRGN